MVQRRRDEEAGLAEAQAGGILATDRIVRGVPPEQDGDVCTGVLHCMTEPKDGIVLLLQRAVVGALDYREYLGHPCLLARPDHQGAGRLLAPAVEVAGPAALHPLNPVTRAAFVDAHAAVDPLEPGLGAAFLQQSADESGRGRVL